MSKDTSYNTYRNTYCRRYEFTYPILYNYYKIKTSKKLKKKK